MIKEIRVFCTNKSCASELEHQEQQIDYIMTIGSACFSNQFVKHIIESITNKIDSLQHTILKRMQGDSKSKKIPNSEQQSNFVVELGKQQEDFHTFLYQPFFRQITEYFGMTSLSLVFQEKTGYSGFYRDWIQFQMMLDMWEDSNGIGIKTIDQIYERWCFLEVSKYLGKILGDLSGGEELIPEVFEEKKKHQFTVLIEGSDYAFILYDNKQYSNLPKSPKQGTKQIYTLVKNTSQKPDITMEMIKGNKRLFWLFDAKYRIDNNSRIQNEIPPKDTVDQMHRYRDALFLKTPQGDKPLPILGAFVLFPGVLDDDYYVDSINRSGVGAFSMLPKSNNIEESELSKFLRKKISFLTKRIQHKEYTLSEEDVLYFTEPNRIPYIPGSYSILRHQVLIVVSDSMNIRSATYQQRFVEGKADFYHMKCHATNRLSDTYQNIIQESQYLSVAHIENSKYFVGHVYPINSVQIQHRNQITTNQSGTIKSNSSSNELYWCFRLNKSICLPQKLEMTGVVGHKLYRMNISELFSTDVLNNPL